MPSAAQRCQPSEQAASIVTRFLSRYRAQDWDGALGILAASRATESPIDFAAFADLYIERIEAFKRNPPGHDWDGVFALQTK